MNDIVWMTAAFWALIVLAVAFVVFASVRRNKLGVNLKAAHCPQCDAAMPAVRKPTSLSQFLWGGWTCPQCGTSMDKWGRRVS